MAQHCFGTIISVRLLRESASYLHCTLGAVCNAEVQPLPCLHLRTRLARAFLLQHRNQWMREVLCESSGMSR